MKTIENEDDYNRVINKKMPILLDFYADWCGPCQSLLPTVEKLSIAYNGKIEIQKVNVDQYPELANKYRVKSIPALYFIKDGVMIDRVIGLATEAQLRAKLDLFIA
jgi:thioredoxin 1